MKKKVLVFILASIILIRLWVQLAQATNGTVSGVIKEREAEINALREEIRRRVEEKLKNIINQGEKRGWIGIVMEKSIASFKLKVKDETRTVVLSEEIQIIGLKREKLSFEAVEPGQKLIAMGYLQSDNSLEARRIVLLPQKRDDRKIQIIFGTINDLSREKEVLVLKPKEQPEKEYQVLLTKQTLLRRREGKEIKSIQYQEMAINQKVIVLALASQNNPLNYQAKLILVLSPLPSPKPTIE